VALVLGLLIFLQVRQAFSAARKQAFDNAEEISQRYAAHIGRTLSEAMLAARTIGQAFEGMKIAWVDDRSLYNSILKQALLVNTNFIGAWSCWEPNALDGKDKDFAGKSGHDASGRFIPLWHRSGADAQLEKLADYTSPGPGDYYLKVLKLGCETPSEPQTFQAGGFRANVIGVTVPLRYNGELVGAVGMLLPAEELQKAVASVRPYQTGFAQLVSESGRCIADANASRIGQTLWAGEAQSAVRNAVLSGKSSARLTYSQTLKTEMYEVTVPIQVGRSGTLWALVVHLPMDKVMAGANRLMIGFTVLGMAGLLITILIVLWLAAAISRPLRVISGELGQIVDSVGEAAAQLRKASRSAAESATAQAASLEETSAALEEMSSMTQRNSHSAEEANRLAREARKAGDEGVRDVQELNTAMQAIKASSGRIAQIIKTIDEIAFQTNILALNAAVEAARAGEAGLGFAVVADEVRSLARRSAEAAKEIADTIESDLHQTAQGVQISAKVDLTLQNIVIHARQVDDLATEVATSSREQGQGIAQVNLAVGQMDKLTQTNAAHADESAGAAARLHAQAEALKHAVVSLLNLVDGQAGRGRRAGSPSPKSTSALAASREAPTRLLRPVDFGGPRPVERPQPHPDRFVGFEAHTKSFPSADRPEEKG